jgi:hypothetical protein
MVDKFLGVTGDLFNEYGVCKERDVNVEANRAFLPPLKAFFEEKAAAAKILCVESVMIMSKVAIRLDIDVFENPSNCKDGKLTQPCRRMEYMTSLSDDACVCNVTPLGIFILIQKNLQPASSDYAILVANASESVLGNSSSYHVHFRAPTYDT